MTVDNDDDLIPVAGQYRDVPLHAGQSPRRLRAVKADIDAAFALATVEDLLALAGDVMRAPEARLLAGAKLEAMHAAASSARDAAPVDLALVTALVAMVSSRNWRSPTHYGSDLDRHGVPRDPDDEPIT